MYYVKDYVHYFCPDQDPGKRRDVDKRYPCIYKLIELLEKGGFYGDIYDDVENKRILRFRKNKIEKIY